jgi:KUP system potassium uptake protein
MVFYGATPTGQVFSAHRIAWIQPKAIAYVVTIGALELLLFAATTTKLLAGGWLPLVIAIIMVGLMTTWQYGHHQVTSARQTLEQPLRQFLSSIQDTTVTRVPGVAVFPHPRSGTTPLALVEAVTSFNVLHEHVIIVRIKHVNVPHVAEAERLEVDPLGSSSDGIVHVTIRVGFMDSQNIPDNLALSHEAGTELVLDLSQARYFLSTLTLESPHPRSLRRGRQQLFITMKKNQSDPIDTFHLPPNRTITLSSELQI